jgi:hypothetical protein
MINDSSYSFSWFYMRSRSECPLVNCVTIDTWQNTSVYELLIEKIHLSIPYHNLTTGYCKYQVTRFQWTSTFTYKVDNINIFSGLKTLRTSLISIDQLLRNKIHIYYNFRQVVIKLNFSFLSWTIEWGWWSYDFAFSTYCWLFPQFLLFKLLVTLSAYFRTFIIKSHVICK